jgi:hypothetical protein
MFSGIIQSPKSGGVRSGSPLSLGLGGEYISPEIVNSRTCYELQNLSLAQASGLLPINLMRSREENEPVHCRLQLHRNHL